MIVSGLSGRLLPLASLLVFVCAAIFSVFYYTAGSDDLETWYRGLNNCFYNSSTWRATFFTGSTKEVGDRFCLFALLISITGIIYTIRRWDRPRTDLKIIRFSRKEAAYYSLICLGAAVGWAYSNRLLAPAYDEIFSAVRIAELHPVQTLSYYMLPNNHILFNLVNNLVAHPFEDKVITGRLLSFVGYAGSLLLAGNWFRRQSLSYISAGALVMVLATQLPAWGFSAQSRGYALQLLAGWGAYTSLVRYGPHGNPKQLYLHALANIAGYALLPSYLYFHAAIVAFAAVTQLRSGRVDHRVWKAQLITAVFVFLFYLPALCFSGMHAFSENRYVTAAFPSVEAFGPSFLADVKYYIAYGFSFIGGEHHKLHYLVFTLPVVLLFSRRNHVRETGLFYFLIWGVFFLLVLFMKRFPFNRNLIIHYSVGLAIIIYSFYLMLGYALAAIRCKWLTAPITAALSFVIAWQFARVFNKDVHHLIYGNNINDLDMQNAKSINQLEKRASIAFSEESFYWFYHCRKQGFRSSRCPEGNEKYFVKRVGEPMPDIYQKYSLFGVYPDDYEVYLNPASNDGQTSRIKMNW